MSFLNIKRIAFYRAKRENIPYDELEDFIKDWWSDKFNLPNNHPLLLQKTLEELMIEYYTDVFKKIPEEARKFELEDLGQVKLSLSSEEQDDEEWFKKMLGDDYVSPDLPIVESKGEEESSLEAKTEDGLDFEDTYNSHTGDIPYGKQ